MLASHAWTSARRAYAAPAVTLDQYDPAPRPEDGFSLSGAQPGSHLQYAASLHIDYARDPLVYENVAGNANTTRVSLVSDQVRAHAAFTLGLYDVAMVYLALPVDLWMKGETLGNQPTATGAGAGDLAFGGRVAIYRGPQAAVALQLGLTAPTGHAGTQGRPGVAGDSGVTAHPEVTSEINAGPLSVLLNFGARMRQDVRFASTRFADSLTFGAGVSVPISRETLRALAELHGATPMDDVGNRPTSPLEALLGMKLVPAQGFTLGLAGGAGLLRGYGAPTLRALLMFGYSSGGADQHHAAQQAPEPAPEAPAPEATPLVVAEQPVAAAAAAAALVDRDKDGIGDAEDECPLAPGAVDRAGCPRFLRYDEHSGEIAFEPTLRFSGDAKKPVPNSDAALEELVALLVANPKLKIRIEAHLARGGDSHKAVQQSVARAASVGRWLLVKGVASERIEAVGCGTNRPIVPEHGAQRAKNERTVAFVTSPLPETGMRSSLGCTAAEITPKPAPAPVVLKEPEPRAPIAAAPAPAAPKPVPAPPVPVPAAATPLTLVPPFESESYKVDLAAGRIELRKPIRFEEGTAELNPRSQAYLVEIAGTLRANPRLKIAIESYVAVDAGAQASLALSQQRAQVVRKRLVDKGIAPERIKAYGCGENRPIAPGNVPWGRKKNERIEIPVLDPAPSAGVHSFEGCSASE